MAEAFIFILIILLILSPVLLIIAIAFGASASRNSKRKKIQERLPANVKYQAPVRLNSEEAQHRFWKFKGFEFSGMIYIVDDKVCIEGTKGQQIAYHLPTAQISWEGVNAKSGLIEWFKISDNNTKPYYVNAETGTFVFSIGKQKYPSTPQIYSALLNQQQLLQTPPPNPSR